MRGSTARALWESQVAVNFALFIRLRDWQVPLFLRIAWVPWSAAGIAAAFLICRQRTVDNQDLWRVFKGVVTAAGLFLFASGHGNLMTGLALPLCWLVV